MDTGRGASHTGVCRGEIGEGQQGVGSWGEIAWGEMPDIGVGGWRQQTTLPSMYLFNNIACFSHVPPNLLNNIYIFKKKDGRKSGKE